MLSQEELFSAGNLAATVSIPAAPTQLAPHTDWPYPGMSPVDSARAVLVITETYHNMLAAVINAAGGARMTVAEVLAAIPQDWRDLCGKYAHATLSGYIAKKHGIEIIYVGHEGTGGFHFEYRAKGGAA